MDSSIGNFYCSFKEKSQSKQVVNHSSCPEENVEEKRKRGKGEKAMPFVLSGHGGQPHGREKQQKKRKTMGNAYMHPDSAQKAESTDPHG